MPQQTGTAAQTKFFRINDTVQNLQYVDALSKQGKITVVKDRISRKVFVSRDEDFRWVFSLFPRYVRVSTGDEDASKKAEFLKMFNSIGKPQRRH